MLADTPLNPAYNRKHNRRELQFSTARALSLGADITAYGHSIQAVEDTVRPIQDTISSTKRPITLYPTQILLDRIRIAQLPKQRVKEYLTDNKLRDTFWQCYKVLRKYGQSRQQILKTVYEAINNNC